VAPYERVKLLQQLSTLLPVEFQGSIQNSDPGAINLVKSIVKTEGFFKLWKGNLCGCLSVIPSIIIRTGVSPFLRSYIVRHDPHKNYVLYLLEELFEEGITTTMTLFLAHPFAVFYSRIASDVTHTGVFSHIYTLWNSHGLFGIYRGVTIALLSALVQKAAFVLITEFCRRYVIENDADQLLGESPKKGYKALAYVNMASQKWLTAHICTHVSSLLTFPLDTLCKCSMALDIPISRSYHQIVNTDGATALYRGIYSHFVTGSLFGVTLVGINILKARWLASPISSVRTKLEGYRVLHSTH